VNKREESFGRLLDALGGLTQEGQNHFRDKASSSLSIDYTILLQETADLSGETSGHDQKGFF